jgi:hypothetical protein
MSLEAAVGDASEIRRLILAEVQVTSGRVKEGQPQRRIDGSDLFDHLA